MVDVFESTYAVFYLAGVLVVFGHGMRIGGLINGGFNFTHVID
jgi:hypothetical protein